MATWRRYAAGVFVTAGILISTLTYNNHVTGQAVAEAAAAAWERSVVASLTSTSNPTFWYTTSTNPALPAVSGMAAISPFIRADQMRYFMDALRSSVQRTQSEGADLGSTWWLAPDEDIEEGDFAEYATPTLIKSSTRWEYTLSDGYLYPTGGYCWVTSGGSVTAAPPKFFTLNSFLTGSNTSSLIEDRFGWGATPSQPMFVPSAVFPYDLIRPDDGLDTSGEFGYIAVTNSFPYVEKGSWWVDSGLHTNVLWQFMSNEWIDVEGDTQRSLWISSGDIAKCRTMAGAMSRSVAIVSFGSDTGTVTHTVTRDIRPEYDYATNTEATTYHGDFLVAYTRFDKEQYTRTVGYDDSSTKLYAWLYDEALEEQQWTLVPSHANPSNSVVTNVSVSASSIGTRYTKVTIDYPSEYAITNGYVSRVRVFLLYTAERGYTLPYATDLVALDYDQDWRNKETEQDWDPGDGLPAVDGTRDDRTTIDMVNNGATCGSMYTGSEVLPDSSDFFDLGVFPQVYQELPEFGVGEDDRTNDVIGVGATLGLSKVRLTLAATVNNPAEYPIKVSFGSIEIGLQDEVSVDYSGEVLVDSRQDYSNWLSGYEDGGTNFAESAFGTIISTEKWQRWCTYRNLAVKPRAIVVVDWNFKHMNPDNPYTPATHTPGWLQ